MFETTFLQYKKNDAEQLEIMEKIRDKLGDHLEVEDRKIFVEEPEIQYTGQAHNIIQFVFKVEFLDHNVFWLFCTYSAMMDHEYLRKDFSRYE